MPPSPIPTDAQKLVLESVDPIVLKQELQNAYERIRQQELEIKKLKFEVEMEQGHVNILRHDNQMLRQMTVDMVVICSSMMLNSLLKLYMIYLIYSFYSMHRLNKRKNIFRINY